jgi:hypothetical protein
MDPHTGETEHDFVLVLSGISTLTSDVEDALFEAGCDDATLSVRSGRVYLTFSRLGASIKDAILTAIQNVRDANIGADVLRVDYCNLVTQADIARRLGRSRQLVHQYINGSRGPGGFPAPVCEICDGSTLWSWCEVAGWLWENDMIKEDVLRESEEVEVINSVLEMEHQRKTRPQLTEEVVKAVQS